MPEAETVSRLPAKTLVRTPPSGKSVDLHKIIEYCNLSVTTRTRQTNKIICLYATIKSDNVSQQQQHNNALHCVV